MYYIAICDDERFTCSDIENYLINYSKESKIKMEIEIYYKGEELWSLLKSGTYYDIIFLDIELLTVNGIDIATRVRKDLKNDITQIVYISGSQEYAMKLFKTRPLDFLVKPIKSQEIIEVFLQAKHLLEKGRETFEFESNYNYYKIPYNQILYFKSTRRKVGIYTRDDYLEFYGKLENIVSEVSNDDFIRIHKSFFVNYDFVIEYSYEWVKMVNGNFLPISQSYRKFVREKLLEKRIKNTHGYRVYD